MTLRLGSHWIFQGIFLIHVEEGRIVQIVDEPTATVWASVKWGWLEPTLRFDGAQIMTSPLPTNSSKLFLFKGKQYVKLGPTSDRGFMLIRSVNKLDGDPEPDFPCGEEEDES